MNNNYSSRKSSRFSFLLRPLAVLLCAYTAHVAQAQYCPPAYDFNSCNFSDDINNFTLNGITPAVISDLNTFCGTNGYTDRTTTIPALDMMQGGTYTGTMTTNSFGSEFYTIWIDFNNNFLFEASEDMTGLQGPFGFLNPANLSITLPFTAPTGVHRMRVKLDLAPPGNIDPCGTGTEFGEAHDYLVNIIAAPACSGAPVITGVTPAGPINTCAGITQTLLLAIPLASGYDIHWQSSSNGGATWSNILNATNTSYTFSVTGNADYRVYVTCTNSSLADTSAAVSIIATPPVFASIPYFEDFENWQDYCADNDVPTVAAGTNWTNQPATGDSSWRRDDEGLTAGWNSFSFFFPPSVSGLHSARFPSAVLSNNGMNGVGNLDLYLDCSAQTGGKQLYFYHYNDNFDPTSDGIDILMSDNGGSSFTLLGSVDSAINWKRHTFPIASNNPQTIIRFRAKKSNWDFSDIGLDSIYVAPPCNGTPVAGTLDPAGPVSSCPGKTFVINNIGGSMGGNINYSWQQSIDLGATWSNVVGGSGNGTQTYTTPSLYDTTYYRLVVTCLTNGSTVITPSLVFNIAPPQYAPVPYFEDFESWISFCDVNDAPSQYWLNNPSTGDSSWRRDDEGPTAGWTPFGTLNPSFLSGAHSARFPSGNFFGGASGNLDLLVDCSAQADPKQLYFYNLNQFDFSIDDSLLVFLSTNNGASFTFLGGWDTADSWTRRSLPIVSNSPQTIIRFQSKIFGFTFFTSDIGIDSLYIAPPCTGTPVAGTISPSGSVSSCPGNSFVLTNVGGSMAGNLQYEWQQSIDGGATWTLPIGGSGNGTFQFTTDPLFDTVSYRLLVTCLGSGIEVVTPVTTINVAPPVYAPLPYSEGFENWISFCDNQDVPSFSWINEPASGDMSWRRDDEGATAGWNNPGFGGYSPVSVEGSHSARIHTSNFNFVNNNFDLFVDCSAPGPKELQFFHINPNGMDQLGVDISTNGGASFTNLTTIFAGSAPTWTLQTLPFISTSATTIIRFTSTTDFQDDMGLDFVNVLLPCDATPVAGFVDSLTPCAGVDFNLGLNGNTLAAGLAYEWQESPDGINWTSIPGATNAISVHNISAPTYFRAIVTCTVTGQSDTSDERLLELATYYYCYCQSAAQSPNDDDIGNVTINKVPSGANLLNNGNASPLQGNPTAVNGYTDFTGITPTPLYKDSVYSLNVTHITSSTFFFGGNVAAWIDYNQDGTFDPFAEQVLSGSSAGVTQTASGNFTVPANAPVGVTGMRVVLVNFGFPSPCGAYFNGETEDYLVDINYQPCNGPAYAGVANITDTLLCPGFEFTLTDTSYEKFRGGLEYVWQSSTDGLNWTDIPGSYGQDTLVQTSGAVETYYRFRLICTNTNESSYSNTLTVAVKPFYQCYCQSFANGQAIDESDVGVFTIGNFVINTGGGHLNNPSAVNPYTDYTTESFPIWLGVDSTYAVTLLHTIKTGNHQDAKVTLFMDFNNNHQYDIPDERVWTGFSSASTPYLNTSVYIPTTAVRNSVTGMRLIINSDINPNVPSDEACGPYTSGETEDYLVEFKNIWELGVGGVAQGAADMHLYPNPTEGKFNVSCSLPRAATDIEMTITDVNGRVISVYSYKTTGKTFQTDLDMSAAARGMYFVTLKAGDQKIIRKLIVQ